MDELKANIPKKHCMYMTLLVRCEKALKKYNLMGDFVQILANIIIQADAMNFKGEDAFIRN